MIISSFLFLADFALGIYLFDVSWVLTAKAVFAAWMALNFGLAVRFLRPVLKRYFTKKENLEDAE